MERRDFLKLASMAGLGVVAGGFPFGSKEARAEAYTGPFWVFINAGGGWDPTSFCDPKGNGILVDGNANNPMNSFPPSVITSVGNIKYADITDGNGVPFNRQFFEAHGSKLTIINGIDMQTNSHDVGSRFTWSGTLTENRPAFAALVAGIGGPTLPMAFITNGGYDVTAGVVAQTRVGNIDALTRIAYPNRIDAEDPNSAGYHTQGTMGRIIDTRNARHQAYLAKQQLPRIKKAMGMLYTARVGQNELQQLTQYLPADFEQAQLRRQVQVALAAYRAGICVSANLDIGGFDTHGNHDQQQWDSLSELFDGVGFLMDQAEAVGVADNIIVCVGSDFGRTPGYNDGNGKDHWPVTSMMFMGKGIPGNRVIGQTTDYHDPMKVDPSTLQVSDSGIRITPGHIHRALRRLAGIDQNQLLAQFPVKESEDLPLFTCFGRPLDEAPRASRGASSFRGAAPASRSPTIAARTGAAGRVGAAPPDRRRAGARSACRARRRGRGRGAARTRAGARAHP